MSSIPLTFPPARGSANLQNPPLSLPVSDATKSLSTPKSVDVIPAANRDDGFWAKFDKAYRDEKMADPNNHFAHDDFTPQHYIAAGFRL